ncbi:MAG: ABC transporter ATP-binding protein [Chloroflexota bacterium]
MPTVISVENLSKSYRLGQIGTGTFAHDLNVWWAKLRGKPNPLLKIGQADHGNRDGEEVWALKDVSFKVEQGEVLGIIGKNGAGKSTLLKILSRVTAPTSGEVKVRGRIASLLEVGTGFHPELTGRENVYLNGAILGMTHQEVTRKFDEIVNFAEVEKYIDTPVKRYSSGMYVRLAFAVAAHLDPEILVVDEVLAVGDAEFQKKCLGKMGQVAGEGRTVLFVSHNMASIATLCSQVLVVDKGEIYFRGDADVGIQRYLAKTFGEEEGDEQQITINGNNFATNIPHRITDLKIIGADGEPMRFIRTGDHVRFRIHFSLTEPIRNLGFRLLLLSEQRAELFRVATDPISGYSIEPQQPRNGWIDCILPKFPFTAGVYYVDVGTVRVNQSYVHTVENAAKIIVQGGDIYGTGVHLTNKAGYFTCDHKWEMSPVAECVD